MYLWDSLKMFQTTSVLFYHEGEVFLSSIVIIVGRNMHMLIFFFKQCMIHDWIEILPIEIQVFV